MQACCFIGPSEGWRQRAEWPKEIPFQSISLPGVPVELDFTKQHFSG